MKKSALVGALVASLSFVGPAVAMGDAGASQGCPKLYSLKEYRQYAAPMYERKFVAKRAHVRAARMERCQHSAWATRTVKRFHRRYLRERTARARIRALTPYSCRRGNYAIPCYIIECESFGGRWDAQNGNALGPYQLLGKGAPWPVRSDADRARHHQIAHDLWAGGAGRSHWAQCL